MLPRRVPVPQYQPGSLLPVPPTARLPLLPQQPAGPATLGCTGARQGAWLKCGGESQILPGSTAAPREQRQDWGAAARKLSLVLVGVVAIARPLSGWQRDPHALPALAPTLGECAGGGTHGQDAVPGLGKPRDDGKGQVHPEIGAGPHHLPPEAQGTSPPRHMWVCRAGAGRASKRGGGWQPPRVAAAGGAPVAPECQHGECPLSPAQLGSSHWAWGRLRGWQSPMGPLTLRGAHAGYLLANHRLITHGELN